MTWTGKIIGDDSAWGDGPGADMALVVGDPAAPGEPLPGKLIPEAPTEGPGGIYLPDLGALRSVDRLALIGFQELNPHWDGIAVVLGDRASLWVTLSAGEAIHLQGSATPALIAALGLSEQGVSGLDAAMDSPDRLPMLLHDAPDDATRTGTLIGAEIGAARTLWLGQQAVLIGDGPVSKSYAKGLQDAHVPVTLTDTKRLKLEGFKTLAKAFAQD